MAKSWLQSDVPAEEWLACLYQCGFACHDCFQPIAPGVRDLGPVLFAGDHEDHVDNGSSDPYWIAVCIECQRQFHDKFSFNAAGRFKGF